MKIRHTPLAGSQKNCLNLITLIKQLSRALEMSGRVSINRTLMIRSSTEYLICISVYFLGTRLPDNAEGFDMGCGSGAGPSRCYLESDISIASTQVPMP